MEIIKISIDNLIIGERYLIVDNIIKFGFGNYYCTYLREPRLVFTNYIDKNNNYSCRLSTPNNFIKKIFKINFDLPEEIQRLIELYY